VALQFLNASHLDVSLISKRVSLMSAWAAGGVEAGGGMAESELEEDAVSAFVEDTFDETRAETFKRRRRIRQTAVRRLRRRGQQKRERR